MMVIVDLDWVIGVIGDGDGRAAVCCVAVRDE
jgi:hypothetical protein